ncbi:MAG TPA: alpha/beta fold hydrolase [Pseudonocardiaceae bacterium]
MKRLVQKLAAYHERGPIMPSSATIGPRLMDTALGPIQFELTGMTGPVVLASHAGIGGVDQARLMLDWLPTDGYQRLLVSRPGYLDTPLAGRESFPQQADLFAALLDALNLPRVAVVTLSSGGPAGYLLAARHPERVTAVVAISSVSGHHEPSHTAGALGLLVRPGAVRGSR